MQTAERLEAYYAFDPSVIDTVSEAMDRQASLGSYVDVFAAANVAMPKAFNLDGYSTRQILDIRPSEHDPHEAVVLHLPMANPLDTNQLYQAASLALSMPNKRIIAMANPSGAGFIEGSLSWTQRIAASHGRFGKVVDPLAAYLERNHIETVENIGASYGTELAASLGAKGTVAVRNMVYVEPASVKRRTTIGLGMKFGSSEPAMQGYIDANELPTFVAARADAISGKDYMKGLMRLSNIAISRGLASGRFEKHALKALAAQHDMRTTFAWGTSSELAVDKAVCDIVDRYEEIAGVGNVQEIQMRGQKHALGNDLALANAIIHEALLAA